MSSIQSILMIEMGIYQPKLAMKNPEFIKRDLCFIYDGNENGKTIEKEDKLSTLSVTDFRGMDFRKIVLIDKMG